MRSRQETGALGEQLAQRYLKERGYAILEANRANTYGEIDIIAERAGGLIFVEVKTRQASETEAALAGITPAKRERLIHAIYLYLHEMGWDEEKPWRIDVIAVALSREQAPKIDHLEDAFDW